MPVNSSKLYRFTHQDLHHGLLRSSQLAMSPAPTSTATSPLDAAFFVIGFDLALEELWAATDVANSNAHNNEVKGFIER